MNKVVILEQEEAAEIRKLYDVSKDIYTLISQKGDSYLSLKFYHQLQIIKKLFDWRVDDIIEDLEDEEET